MWELSYLWRKLLNRFRTQIHYLHVERHLCTSGTRDLDRVEHLCLKWKARSSDSFCNYGNVELVNELIYTERRLTMRDVAEKLSLSPTTVHRILTEQLKISKLSARWLPRFLQGDGRRKRVECSREFLSRYHMAGDGLPQTRNGYTFLCMSRFSNLPHGNQLTPLHPRRLGHNKVARRRCLSASWTAMHFFYSTVKVRDGWPVNAEHYSKVLLYI